MGDFEPRNIFSIDIVENNIEFSIYLDSNPTGFRINSFYFSNCKEKALYADTGDFRKWVNKTFPHVNVETQESDNKVVLHGGEYWFPLIFLASDVTLPLFLNMVANYLYEKMRGCLKGEKARCRLNVVYEDTTGVTKKFEFEGDSDALEKIINKIDIDRVLTD